MRVAIDATPLVLSSGGLARYVAELSRGLADSFPGDDFILLSDQSFAMPDCGSPNLRRGRLPRNILERRWWLWGLHREMSRLNCDVFHGTNFAAPYLPLLPSVVTLHDLSPWMDPRWHHQADRVRRLHPADRQNGHSDDDYHSHRGDTPPGNRAFWSPGSARGSHTARGIGDVSAGSGALAINNQFTSAIFSHTGVLEPRKNLSTLMDAWRTVRVRHDVDLVLAGRRRADFAELPAEPGLHVLGEVTDAELAGLYSGALAFVYPSHYEGFGLPVLEAMQCGACVLISKDPALREVAGPAGLSLDGVGSWVEAMSAVASQPAWVARQREKSLARARDFSWARSARLTREVYEEARRRFSD